MRKKYTLYIRAGVIRISELRQGRSESNDGISRTASQAAPTKLWVLWVEHCMNVASGEYGVLPVVFYDWTDASVIRRRRQSHRIEGDLQTHDPNLMTEHDKFRHASRWSTFPEGIACVTTKPWLRGLGG
jgi:hypothetical protein